MPGKKPAGRKAAVHEVTLRKYLGRALRDHRRQHALTISQVAELARISPGMLSKIENGQVAPTLDVIERTSTALGLTLGQLFQKYAVPDGSARIANRGDEHVYCRGQLGVLSLPASFSARLLYLSATCRRDSWPRIR